MFMIPIRLTIFATALALPPISAGAEPATTTSAVNLRSGASTTSAILSKIPAGTLVQASHCSDWCEVEWLRQKGFAIATALGRRGLASALRSPNATADNPVPMALPKVDETSPRYQGPFVGAAGPGRGYGWLGYRGRW